MPCLSGRFDPAVGVLLNVTVVAPGSINPAVAASGSPINISAYPALLDTGATMTCISPILAQSLGLQPIGLQSMMSATHIAVPTNLYLVDLGILFGQQVLMQQGMQVLEFACPATSPYQLLLGRDVICRGAFAMSFDGHYTLSL